MNNLEAYYHSIETFGTVDGPGIRYVLFLAGCDVGCTFCHNPDTWSRGSNTITIQKVLEELESYRAFYEKSGGGLTVSGGEPMLQADFVADLFKEVKKNGFSTVLDTSGHINIDAWDKVLEYTDIVQFSLKAVGEKLHKQLTRLDNKAILNNLKYVADKNKVVLRYVVIPGFTDNREEIKLLSNLLKQLPATVDLEFLPYHDLGKEKWASMNLTYKLDSVPKATDKDIERVKSYLN